MSLSVSYDFLWKILFLFMILSLLFYFQKNRICWDSYFLPVSWYSISVSNCRKIINNNLCTHKQSLTPAQFSLTVADGLHSPTTPSCSVESLLWSKFTEKLYSPSSISSTDSVCRSVCIHLLREERIHSPVCEQTNHCLLCSCYVYPLYG